LKTGGDEMAENINADKFESEVLKSEIPVLVDFWAEWCGPCKMMAPVMDELSQELTGKVKVVKVNVDEAQNTASQYGIMSIPTIILFKGGKEIARLSGAMPKDPIIHWLESNLE
jgi:thioredoxin 1